ncbi:MAG TPA: hypothetical protein VFZ73_05180 [Gemmatimonadaceae bacterium]
MPGFRAITIRVVCLTTLASTPVIAQAWNDPRVTALVARATERRARQLADTGLTDYTATALGSLTFLAQIGEGFPDPPKVVKADQLALEVYWRAPNYSKQLILGRRDTLLLPTDIEYHRDHLGIVQNNFPEIIRLGEGDEVRDVPHPLSAAGMRAYDFAITDSMRIQIPGQEIEVYEVRIRPRDGGAPAAVGSVYLSRADAQVVRMAFSFTRAALLDPQLDDVAIVLDNALIEGRFWLPRRQEIEIRRSGTWLDFPARGIIRGGFEVCCYRINTGAVPVRFTGPEIELAPPDRRAAYRFEEPLSAVVPADLATVSSEEVARVQARAAELVGQAALARARSGALLASSVSDLIHVNRAEGLSLGAGVRRRIGAVHDLAVSGRYGVSDERLKGVLALTLRLPATAAVRARAFDENRDASDVAEVSGLRNSISAQEFGADYTEPYRVRGFDVRFEQRIRQLPLYTLTIAREWTDSVPVEAMPARGDFRPTPAVLPRQGWRGELAVLLAPRPWLGGSLSGRVALQIRLRAGETSGHRQTLLFDFERRFGAWSLAASAFAGWSGSALAEDSLHAGGPVSAPGYAIHQFSSNALLWQRFEARLPIPFPSIPIGRWGRSPARATFAPMAGLVLLVEDDPIGQGRLNGYPWLGAGVLLFFDLVRIDVGRGFRNGRWTFGVDLSRDLWRIL